jgi:hypothetical protein
VPCSGSIIAGVPVAGDLLVTATRITADVPASPDPPMFNGHPVTTRPVQEVLWSDAPVATTLAAAATPLHSYTCQQTSLVHALPRRYVHGKSWSGPRTPEQLLKAATSHLPGCTIEIEGTAPEHETAPLEAKSVEFTEEEGRDVAADHAALPEWVCQDCKCKARGVLPSARYVTEGTGETAEAARQQAALELLHRCAVQQVLCFSWQYVAICRRHLKHADSQALESSAQASASVQGAKYLCGSPHAPWTRRP